jgi:hypothetical protein
MSKARDLANAGTALGAVTATELGYVDGVTSAIQTQIDAKEATLPSQTGNSGKYLTTNGTAKSWGTVSQYALPTQTGNSGKYLTTDGSAESWGAVSAIPANATATVATEQVTSSTSYTDLTTAGPAVTLTTGTKALVIVTGSITAQTAGTSAFMSYTVSGATTIAASDTVALVKMQNTSTQNDLIRASAVSVPTLTAGSNTFTSKYRGDGAGNNNTFKNRTIFVMNLA